MRPPDPIASNAIWAPDELTSRPEWNHRLDDRERDELVELLDLPSSKSIEQLDRTDLPLTRLAPRLRDIRQQLEEGAGAVRIHRFPCDGLDEQQARLLYWAFSIHLGTPVSQSPDGERIFSVRDAGFGPADPRSRGPNTSKRLSFHTDRADVVGFLCLQQAREGGENEVASAPAVYNRILAERPDLLEVLMQPFHYLRHSLGPWR